MQVHIQGLLVMHTRKWREAAQAYGVKAWVKAAALG